MSPWCWYWRHRWCPAEDRWLASASHRLRSRHQAVLLIDLVHICRSWLKLGELVCYVFSWDWFTRYNPISSECYMYCMALMLLTKLVEFSALHVLLALIYLTKLCWCLMQYLFYLLMLRVFLALIYSVSRDTVVSFYLVEKFETCHKYSCEWALASCLINFVGLGFLQPLLTALFITCIKRQKFNFINSGPVDIIRTEKSKFLFFFRFLKTWKLHRFKGFQVFSSFIM